MNTVSCAIMSSCVNRVLVLPTVVRSLTVHLNVVLDSMAAKQRNINVFAPGRKFHASIKAMVRIRFRFNF